MNLIDFCLKWSERIHRRVIPGARYAQYDYEDVLAEHVRSGVRWLDVGCGHHVLPDWRADRERQLVAACEQVVGIDYDMPSLREHRTITTLLRGSASNLPFADGSFDLVTANMVVEHLDNPLGQFQEIHRVLKPGGLFLFHTPNVWGYNTVLARFIPEGLKSPLIFFLTGRKEEDVFPTFYRANSRSAIQAIASQAGFRSASTKMTQGQPMAMFLLVPPLYVAVLLWVKLLLANPFRNLRDNIIATLQKAD